MLHSQVPNLVLAQRVIDKMVAGAKKYLMDETGEAMIGLVDPGVNTGGVPTIYVLDTISPDESAERALYAFEQGDDRQGDIFMWLHANWQLHRQQPDLAKKWDSDLHHVGDWHKQPGYMIAPSGGDLHSALDQLEDSDSGLDFLLVPIVTLGHPATTQDGVGVNYVSVKHDDGSSTRIDFWYIHRDVPTFYPISPIIYPDDQLPQFAPYPWHIQDENRADLEIGQLEFDGLFVSDAMQWDIDQTLPLEICFIVARKEASKLLLLVTPHDYPKAPPRAYIAPFQPMNRQDDIYDVFERLLKTAQPYTPPPDWQWTPDLYLIDYVHSIEDAIGIIRPQPAAPDADALVNHPTEADEGER